MNVLSDHRGPRNRPSSPRPIREESHGGSSTLAQPDTFVWFGLQIVFSQADANPGGDLELLSPLLAVCTPNFLKAP